MIQFNLLPTIKLDYVKTQRNKRMTMAVSTLVIIASLTILVLLFFVVQIVQQQHSKHLSADIKTEAAKLEAVPDLDKILTIQNQLNSMSALHDKKPVTSRLTSYIKKLTPANINITSLTVDFGASTMTIEGLGKSASTVNKFVDTLKFTKYKTAETEANAFSSVVLSAFGRDGSGKVTYQVSLNYDPAIFSSASDVELVIPPNMITTRSQTEKPESIFETPVEETE